MIKCQAIKEFTLEKFDELKNIERKNVNTKGKLYVGDTFECTKEMADYLMGSNAKGEVVAKVLEIIPEKNEVKDLQKELANFTPDSELTKYVQEKPKKKKTSKK